MNSSQYYDQLWSGNLGYNETDTVNLSAIPIYGTSHIINIETLLPNNQNDINTSNNSKNMLFETESGTSINIHLITDNYATETSWRLLDQNNIIIDSVSTLDNNTSYIYNYCVSSGCYKFIINDSEGDGICCNYGNGYYGIKKELNNQTLNEGSQFSFSDTLDFCVSALSNTIITTNSKTIYPNPSCGRIFINSSIFTNDIPIFATLFDIHGRRIFSKEIKENEINLYEQETGFYVLQLKQDEIITTHKLILKK